MGNRPDGHRRRPGEQIEDQRGASAAELVGDRRGDQLTQEGEDDIDRIGEADLHLAQPDFLHVERRVEIHQTPEHGPHRQDHDADARVTADSPQPLHNCSPHNIDRRLW